MSSTRYERVQRLAEVLGHGLVKFVLQLFTTPTLTCLQHFRIQDETMFIPSGPQISTNFELMYIEVHNTACTLLSLQGGLLS